MQLIQPFRNGVFLCLKFAHMKKYLMAAAICLACQWALSSDSLLLVSPDGAIKVRVWQQKELYYEVKYNDALLLSPSSIDFVLKNGKALSVDNKIKSTVYRKNNTVIESPVPEKRIRIPDIYNELTIQFSQPFSVAFRVYNDGVAYRILTRFKDTITVSGETAFFNFPKNHSVYFPQMQKKSDADEFQTRFEELYPVKQLDSIAKTDLAFSPVLIAPLSGPKIAITEADLEDYPGMFLRGTASHGLAGVLAPYPAEELITEADYPEKVVTKRADFLAITKGTRSFPWRVLLIAKKDKELPSNDIVYRLASPSRVADVSWVNPGKGTDEWTIGINLFNVPFKTSVNTNVYKYYIDFAKRFGFNRIMMDEGWSDHKDLFKINPNINMDTLAAYAREKGIKLSMWTLALTLDRQLDSALTQFNKWGVDFIMTDFIDRDDQKTVNFYHRIAKACADHHLMIMYHGAYPPKGFNRTYPNAVTRESVLGSEYNAWSDKPSPEHDVTLPFTRMLSGPLDYEPGILDNATKAQFRPISEKVMSQGTRCHQLAMFVVYDSPIQIFSGNPSQGLLEAAFMNFLGSIPTTWDETVILDAKLSDYIITARKKGNDWFIGGMTDWTARDFTMPLNFLGAGNYDVTICKDGVNADRYASDYLLSAQSLQAMDTLKLHLAPGGGFVVRIKKN